MYFLDLLAYILENSTLVDFLIRFSFILMSATDISLYYHIYYIYTYTYIYILTYKFYAQKSKYRLFYEL